jgi:hypothetical protein
MNVMSSEVVVRPETISLIKGSVSEFQANLVQFKRDYTVFKEMAAKLSKVAEVLHGQYQKVCKERCGFVEELPDGSLRDRCTTCEIESYCGAIGYLLDDLNLPTDL